MQRPRRIPLAVAIASLSVVVTGCGVTQGSSATDVMSAGMGQVSSAAAVVQAAEQTAEVTSLKTAVEVVITDAAGDAMVTTTTEGGFDLAAERGSVTTAIDAGIEMLEGFGTLEAVYDGDVVYLKVPYADELTDGKPWISVDASKLADLGPELERSMADPTSLLDLLTEVGGPVTELGTETVRGVPTRHVGLDIEIGKILDQAAEERAGELRSTLDGMGIDVDSLATIPAEAWIDDDGFVRRFTMAFDLGALAADLGAEGAGEAGELRQTVELYDLNEPVEVAVPPADQVGELDFESIFGD